MDSFSTTFIALSVLAVILLVPGLVWHIKNRNLPAVFLLSWLFIMDMETLINACIWGGDDYYLQWDGKGYCDVMVKLNVGASVGIVCAITALSFNLYIIMNAETTFQLNVVKKNIIDCCICLIMPILIMAVNYVIQGSRYAINKHTGCGAATSETWVTILLYSMWPLLWSLTAFIFATLTLIKFFVKRKDVKDILLVTNSGLNITRFARLLIFCFLVILVMLPLSIYNFVNDISYITGDESTAFKWSVIHSEEFWNIIFFVNLPKSVLYNVWIMFALSYMSFIIFGLGSDALEMYKNFLIKFKVFKVIFEWMERKRTLNNEKRINQLYDGYAMGGHTSPYTESSGSDSPFDKDLEELEMFEVDYNFRIQQK